MRSGSIICTTEFDIDLERKVVAILVARAMQLACSNNLRNDSILDISPLLDGSTKLFRLRNDNQYIADGRGPGLIA